MKYLFIYFRHAPLTGGDKMMTNYFDKILLNPKNDPTEIYEFYKSQLKLISAVNEYLPKETHFIMKDATHMLFLESILKIFPDACIIHTFRSIESVIGSTCSAFFNILEIYHEINENNIQKKKFDLAIRVVYFYYQCTRRWMSFIVKNKPKNVFFCDFNDLVSNPVFTVKRIYKFFGFLFTSQMEEKIKYFLEEDNKKRKQKHLYSIKEYGLNSQILDILFGKYISFCKEMKN